MLMQVAILDVCSLLIFNTQNASLFQLRTYFTAIQWLELNYIWLQNIWFELENLQIKEFCLVSYQKQFLQQLLSSSWL